jgi:hypothetical protein
MNQEWIDENKKFIQKITDHFGHEKVVAALLMSFGNTIRHLAQICHDHNDNEAWNRIMEDKVIALCANFSKEFLDIRDTFKNGKIL